MLAAAGVVWRTLGAPSRYVLGFWTGTWRTRRTCWKHPAVETSDVAFARIARSFRDAGGVAGGRGVGTLTHAEAEGRLLVESREVFGSVHHATPCTAQHRRLRRLLALPPRPGTATHPQGALCRRCHPPGSVRGHSGTMAALPECRSIAQIARVRQQGPKGARRCTGQQQRGAVRLAGDPRCHPRALPGREHRPDMDARASSRRRKVTQHAAGDQRNARWDVGVLVLLLMPSLEHWVDGHVLAGR